MEKQEVDLKRAVQIATNVIRDLYHNVEIKDLLLEEIEKSDGTWLVTMSFTRELRSSSLEPLLGVPPKSQRLYKRIRIDAQTGEFLGMEIRELQTDYQSR